MIDCRKCEHYFVTWDPERGHGCRAMGFKSRLLPSEEVRRSTRGRPCRLYRPKIHRRRSVRHP